MEKREYLRFENVSDIFILLRFSTFDFDEETESAEEQQPPTRDLRREKFVNKISLYGTVGKKPEEFGTEGKDLTRVAKGHHLDLVW